ncbi:hypothetical protein ACHAC9_24650, partial [Massilia sp. CMS3.1]|uniref:hypothetical protein n=1 Tax=Massilia sp. CMS3.1 TaxID=3373083 RepID=UPI003EE4331C
TQSGSTSERKAQCLAAKSRSYCPVFFIRYAMAAYKKATPAIPAATPYWWPRQRLALLKPNIPATIAKPFDFFIYLKFRDKN